MAGQLLFAIVIVLLFLLVVGATVKTSLFSPRFEMLPQRAILPPLRDVKQHPDITTVLDATAAGTSQHNSSAASTDSEISGAIDETVAGYIKNEAFKDSNETFETMFPLIKSSELDSAIEQAFQSYNKHMQQNGKTVDSLFTSDTLHNVDDSMVLLALSGSLDVPKTVLIIIESTRCLKCAEFVTKIQERQKQQRQNKLQTLQPRLSLQKQKQQLRRPQQKQSQHKQSQHKNINFDVVWLHALDAPAELNVSYLLSLHNLPAVFLVHPSKRIERVAEPSLVFDAQTEKGKL